MKIKSFLSQVLEQTDLTPVEKVKILAAKLKDIDVQFASTISDLSQHHQMMTNWYNNLKKNWPKLHDSTNSDGNGHCLIIKREFLNIHTIVNNFKRLETEHKFTGAFSAS